MIVAARGTRDSHARLAKNSPRERSGSETVAGRSLSRISYGRTKGCDVRTGDRSLRRPYSCAPWVHGRGLVYGCALGLRAEDAKSDLTRLREDTRDLDGDLRAMAILRKGQRGDSGKLNGVHYGKMN